MTKAELMQKGYIKHHTSYIKLYVSRKEDQSDNKLVYTYKGRFGIGYVEFTHNWKSTWFSYITYWIEPKDKSDYELSMYDMDKQHV